MAKKKPEKKPKKPEFFEFQGHKAINLGDGIFAASDKKKENGWSKEARYFCAIVIIVLVALSIYAYSDSARAPACPEGMEMNLGGECVEVYQFRIDNRRYDLGQDNLTYNAS